MGNKSRLQVRSKVRQQGILVTALVSALLLVLGALGAPASAAPSQVKVSGVVQNAELNPIQLVTVELFGEDPTVVPSTPVEATSSTDENGHYEFEVTADEVFGRQVWLRFSKDEFKTIVSGPHLIRGNGEEALPDSFLEVSEANYGTLTGSVVDPDGNLLLTERSGIFVYALGGEDDDFEHFEKIKVSNVDAGQWSASLAPGQYRVRVNDSGSDWQGAWAGPDGQTYSTATTFQVTKKWTTQVPQVQLTDGARISGKVTDSTGAAIRGITVHAFASDDVAAAVSDAQTNSRGEYTLRNLDEGSYRLRFSDGLGDYETKWYENSETFAAATAVTVTENQKRLGVNIELAEAQTETPTYNVTGTVDVKNGDVQREAQVTAFRQNGSNWEYYNAAPVRKGGAFGFGGLPVGTYKFQVTGDVTDDDPGIEERWFGGSATPEDAEEFAVGETGTLNLGKLTVARMGTISATITLEAVEGWPSSDAVMEIFDATGKPIDLARVNAVGKYVARVAPGAYTVEFSGKRHNASTAKKLEFVPQWWKNGYSPTTATKVVVGDGQAVTGLNATLSRNLTAVEPPTVSGSALTGKTLTVSPGTWAFDELLAYSYQWEVGGIAAGSSATYKVKAADRGKAITATVRAIDDEGKFGAGTATSKAVLAKEVSTLALAAKAGKRKATVTVGLTLPGTSARSTAGSVKIYDGNKLVKTVKVSKGKASVTLKLKKGKRALKAVYAGSTQYTGSAAVRSVTVK